MKISNKQEPLLLLLGDLGLLYFSLWVTLALRYMEIPPWELFTQHLVPFSIIFVLWIGVFFIAGLYEKHTLLLKGKLPVILFNAQGVNSALAVLFFYLVPFFGITPKVTLFIYLVVSSALLFVWRIYGVGRMGMRRRQRALLIGSGDEMKELRDEINGNPRYGISLVASIDLDATLHTDLQKEIADIVSREGVSLVIVDMENKKFSLALPQLYRLIFSGVRFVDQHKAYEDIFDRIPFSLVGDRWFLENIADSSSIAYDIPKRLMDTVIAAVLSIPALVLLPFVALLVKLDDGGPVFFTQERMGKNNTIIKILKFRTMGKPKGGKDAKIDDLRITRIGKWLRKSRIDELPQLLSVLRGDLSLVGPRPELPELVEFYEKEIPYYRVRHLIKPGLSGWAQIKDYNAPRQVADIDKTRTKLSYDLYYIKNRSFLLDLKIALQTIKTILSQSGA